FQNQGQICLCGSRIYVEQSIYAQFKKDFVAKTQQLKVGDPLEPDTQVGAIVSELHFQKILSYLRLAREEGGVVLCGGKAVQMEGRCANGLFIEPTIIEGLDIHCRTNQEEIFGPVVTITPFSTDSEALKFANSSEYGLASVVWTQNLTRAHRIADAIESGIVWINCWLERDLRTPFGGVKQSGVGREGGLEALRFFTETKNITIQL
ncbi:MAG: aldehyde dehydrogenase family protein, partial [Chitinophagales bacterium]